MRFALLLCLSRLVLSIHAQNAADVDPSSSSISLEFDGISDEESQRHKRALGILLQGFMEALGYQVSPIQIATLPAAQNPVAAAAAPPMMQLMPNGSSMPAAAAATPRQRETLRFTGVFNFGNNVNATNLVDHLAQYERIFHGNNGSSTTAPAASSGNKKSKKKSKKQKKPPIPDPLFVKIPLPIAPDLPVAQPMPDDHEFYDHDSHEQHLDEFHESDDETGKHGHYQEEHDDSRHSEEYQKNHDEHYEDYEPYNRNYPGKKGKEEEEEEADDNNSGPKEKLTEYKNNRNVVNYRVENKELHHPDEVAEEVPPPMSPPLTTLADVDGPASDWRETDEKRALEVAAEQEALAEALAEKNAERESEARNRQRERDDEGEANYEAADKLLCDENCEDSEANVYGKSEEDVEEAADDNANKENNQRSYQARPVAQQRGSGGGNGNEAKLRDSYGKSLQDAEGGPIDERLSGYFSMFKDPDSGLYDPDRIKEYESARLPFYDYSEFLDGFNKIQRQMSGVGNKYEEYDIDKSLAGDLRAEHRSRDEEAGNTDAASRSAKECKCDKSGENSNERSAAAGSTTRSFGPGAQKSVAAAGPSLPSTTFSPYFFASYDPYETKEEIIARLTSYEPITRPATAALFSADDAARTSLPPPPPIGLAAERLLHDAAEIKEIESWPEARPSPSTKTLNLFRPAQQLTTASTRKKQQNVEILDENDRTPWVPLVPIDAKRRSSIEQQQQQQQRSQSKLAAKATLNSYEATTTTTSTISTTTSTTTSRPTNHRSSYVDSGGGGGGTTKRPSSSFLGASVRNFLPSTRRYRYQARSPRPTKTMKKKKKKYDFYTTKPAPTRFAGSASAVVPTTIVEPTSNYVDDRGDGVPLITEPTPYYYDERVGPFAEELLPQNTKAERGVNVKEYRNHVESVKVTEQRLRPEGTTQRIFKYTRRL